MIRWGAAAVGFVAGLAVGAWVAEIVLDLTADAPRILRQARAEGWAA